MTFTGIDPYCSSSPKAGYHTFSRLYFKHSLNALRVTYQDRTCLGMEFNVCPLYMLDIQVGYAPYLIPVIWVWTVDNIMIIEFL